VVYTEWWRGKTDIREELLAAVVIEDMPPNLCRAAGEALGRVKSSTLPDAVVMASAALRGGGVVYTSDEIDLKRLSRHFPTVIVVGI
jgi:predicted nucleic acid-binding protein